MLVAAVMAATQNDYEGSGALARESLRIGQLVKDAEVVAWSMIHIAVSGWVAGDVATALETFQSVISLSSVMGLSRTELTAMTTVCGVWASSGDLERAFEVGNEALTASRKCGELWQRGYLLNFLSMANWSRGERQLAESQAREGAACKRALDDRTGLSILLETLAWMAAERAAYQRAATLLGSAEHVRELSSLPLLEPFRAQHETSVAVVRRGLSQTSFDAAFQRGLAMTIDEGMTLAVNDGQQQSRATAPSAPSGRGALTRREAEIARLLAEDLTNREIAGRLSLSERTVQTHVTNMLNKLGLRSRGQIVRWVAESAG
jgi:non-specific serine/threonine protein kinase